VAGSRVEQSAATVAPDGAPPPPPPSAQIFGMAIGAYVPQMLYVVAKQGIADLLVDGPRTSADLAAATGLHERSLYRVLRSLTGLGFFTEESRGLFRLTPLGYALTSADGSGGRELMLLVDWWSKAIAEFPRTVETGRSGMELAFGMGFLRKEPRGRRRVRPRRQGRARRREGGAGRDLRLLRAPQRRRSRRRNRFSARRGAATSPARDRRALRRPRGHRRQHRRTR
jgi:hypothetical protein